MASSIVLLGLLSKNSPIFLKIIFIISSIGIFLPTLIAEPVPVIFFLLPITLRIIFLKLIFPPVPVILLLFLPCAGASGVFGGGGGGGGGGLSLPTPI